MLIGEGYPKCDVIMLVDRKSWARALNSAEPKNIAKRIAAGAHGARCPSDTRLESFPFQR